MISRERKGEINIDRKRDIDIERDRERERERDREIESIERAKETELYIEIYTE